MSSSPANDCSKPCLLSILSSTLSLVLNSKYRKRKNANKKYNVTLLLEILVMSTLLE